MTTIMLDSCVVSALLDPEDALHKVSREKYEDAQGDDVAFTISVVTWSETLIGALRGAESYEGLLRAFVDQAIDDVVVLDQPMATSAGLLHNSHRSLRLPDAMIIATAQEFGADVLLTGDKKLKSVAPDLVELVCP